MQMNTVDELMSDKRWHHDWALWRGPDGRFHVIHLGMPIGVQKITTRTSAIEACLAALEISEEMK